MIDGETGVLFEEQTVESIIAAVQRLNTLKFDSAAIRAHAENFSTETFRQKMTAFVEEKYAESRQSYVRNNAPTHYSVRITH